MKLRLLVFILILTTALWAQTANQTAPPPAQGTAAATSDTKPQCPCCQKADGKSEMACCAHHAKTDQSDKEAMSCCQGKDSMSCMKSKPEDSAKDSSTPEKCCGGQHKDCCAKADQGTERAAMACCKGASGQCGMHHHDHGDMDK